MKILYICSDSGIPVLGRKGASVHVRSLASAFTRAGHDVVVATSLLTKSPWEAAAALDAQLLHIPVEPHVVSAVDTVRAYGDALGVTSSVPSALRRILYNQHLEAKLVRRFRDARPDFVYERAALYSTAGLTVARALGVPLAIELNAPLGLEQSTYRGAYLSELASAAERRTLIGADVVLTVSAPLREYVIGEGVHPERVVVMPNGVDPVLFRPGQASETVRARWGIGPGPVLGFVGGLREWHGVSAFPGLLEQLAVRYPTLQLVIGGDGPLRAELASAFARRGLADRVVFTGQIAHEEIPGLVRTFDVALAPYEETQHLFYFSPLKLFEYMGCGVPVVAAALGQIADVVEHDGNGLLYPAGDLESMVDACGQLLADPARRQRLGRMAAQSVHWRYTWRENARRVVDLISRPRVAAEVA